jgi:hypothetical protein
VLVLVVSIAGLARPQALVWFGVEVIAFAVVTWLISARAVWTKVASTQEGKPGARQVAFEVTLYQISVLPFVAGGVILALDDPSGMYWVVFGMIAAIVISMLTTWVLLIEILR